MVSLPASLENMDYLEAKQYVRQQVHNCETPLTQRTAWSTETRLFSLRSRAMVDIDFSKISQHIENISWFSRCIKLVGI